MLRCWIDRIVFWAVIAAWFAGLALAGPFAKWVASMNGTDGP